MWTTKMQISLRICKTVASFWSRAGQFKSYLVANPEDRFSRDVAHKVQTDMISASEAVNFCNWQYGF